MADQELALERHIRDVLVASRPTGGAPLDLRVRVLSIADRAPRSRFARAVLGLGWLAAGSIAATSAVVLLLSVLATRGAAPVETPGSGATPTAVPFDPTRTGIGILSTVPSTLQWIPAIVTITAVVVAVWLIVRYRTRRRASSLIGTVLSLALALGALALSQHPGFVWGGGAYAPLVGLGAKQDPAPGSGGVTTFYETAEPRGAFGVLVTLTNPGPLPIRLEGLVQPAPIGVAGPQWTALWLGSDPDVIAGSLDHVRPFEPIEVAPNGTVDLYLIGRTGACAFGPTFQLSTGVGGYLSIDRDLELAYSVFGLERESVFTLPFAIAEPNSGTCSG